MFDIIFTVPQSHCVVIERFGRFSRVCSQGLHFRIPIIEQPRYCTGWGVSANKRGYVLELTEQQTDTPLRTCQTKDNVTIQANASVYWRILDPIKALYEVDVLPRAVSDIALNALRAIIGKITLDQVFSERQKLNEIVASQLSKVSQKWGIQFTRVEIQELKTSDATESAMLQEMAAERRRRAVVTEAEGRAAAEIKMAEAERQAAILRADGKAQALEKIAYAEMNYLQKLSGSVNPTCAGQILIAQKFLDGFDKITMNQAHKVFLPNSFSGLFSLPTDDSPTKQGGSPSE